MYVLTTQSGEKSSTVGVIVESGKITDVTMTLK
jgi:hypothetical protein